MRIAMVGAGALGRIYGVRLAATHDVTWVVRPARLAERGPFRIETATPLGAVLEDREPRRVDAIPAGAEIAIITLRFDSIVTPDDDLRRSLAAPEGTMVVCLSPVFPAQHEALEALVGHPVVSAMPGVSGYLDARGVVRHWVPPMAPTMIDDGSVRWGDEAAIEADPEARAAVARRERLVQALDAVGLPARLEADVEAVDAATTTSFFPLIAAVAVGGSLRGVVADRALLARVKAATAECMALAPRLGTAAPWASMMGRLLGGPAGPLALRSGAVLGRMVAPEVIHFVDEHFGPKLRDQHLAMGEHLLALAAEHGVDTPALCALVARVRAAPGPRDPGVHRAG
jgi:ketopantoate reductase